MSSDDDIFLKTFNEMITILKEVNNNIISIKENMEDILPSIDGLGAGLTNIKTQLSDLARKMDTLSNDIKSTAKDTTTAPISKKVPEKVAESKKKDTIEKVEKIQPSIMPHANTPQHPIFIDLSNKINEVATFKEAGDILVDALEQIESNFSFSRVFYEIRRYGNSLSRKGTNEISPNERLEITEKILDWEQRLTE